MRIPGNREPELHQLKIKRDPPFWDPPRLNQDLVCCEACLLRPSAGILLSPSHRKSEGLISLISLRAIGSSNPVVRIPRPNDSSPCVTKGTTRYERWNNGWNQLKFTGVTGIRCNWNHLVFSTKRKMAAQLGSLQLLKFPGGKNKHISRNRFPFKPTGETTNVLKQMEVPNWVFFDSLTFGSHRFVRYPACVRAPGKAPRARRSTLQYPAAGPAPATFQQIYPPKESPNVAFLKLHAHPILALGPGKSALEIPDLGQNEPAENRGSSLASQRSRAKNVPHMYPCSYHPMGGWGILKETVGALLNRQLEILRENSIPCSRLRVAQST